MRILHISTNDYGGAGLCCIRLHIGLLANGVSSKVLVLNKSFSEQGVYKYEKEKINLPKAIRWPLLFIKLVFKKLRIPLSKQQMYQFKLDNLRAFSSPVYSLPLSQYDLSSHPLVKEADLIHLHWTAGFLDFPSFFKAVFKPIVWTIHDENLYYGGFHFQRDRSLNLTLYSNLEEKLILIKKESINQSRNLSIVSLSNMMLDLSLKNNIAKLRKHYLIHNSVDAATFKPYDKSISRKIFNLPENKKVVLFVSYYLNDKNKGFNELLMALNELHCPNLALFAVGIGKAEIPNTTETYYSSVINDQRFISFAYSAADIFVMPSFQEGFAQTPLEAMACGLPVVAFPCSGTEELINESNGVRASDFSITSLKNSLKEALSKQYNSDWIRQDVLKRFGVKQFVNQYMEVYKKSLSAEACTE